MIEDEFKLVLDRGFYPPIVRKHYSETLDLLKEVTNYGARLIVRCFSLSKRRLPDIVVVANLLKQAITFLDSIEILVSHGAVTSSALPLRSLFEVRLYTKWILKEDTEYRSKIYYVWHLRKTIAVNNWAIEGTNEKARLKELLRKNQRESVVEKASSYEKEAIKHNLRINDLLKSEHYREINDLYENTDKRKKEWYSINKRPSSLREIAKKLDLEDEYAITYSKFSRIAHGTALHEHIKFVDDKIILENVRGIKEASVVLNGALTNAMDLYRTIITHYIPNELENYNRKYRIEWRERFKNIPEVNIKSSGTIDI